MRKEKNTWNHEMDEEEYRAYLPTDSIEEMEYEDRKQRNENNVGNVARAVLVVALIGLVCAVIDYYVEKL